MQSDQRNEWIASAKEEFNNFLSRNAWKKVSRDKVIETGRKILGTKKVFKIKHEQDGSTRYKTRDVLKGFMQVPGVD